MKVLLKFISIDLFPDICNDLRAIPDIFVEEHFYNLLKSVRKRAEEQNIKVLLDWLEHKDHNPWVLQCLCQATSKMSREDWFSSSTNTNIAESAHAQGQREGIKLTLVSAVRLGMKMDKRFFETKTAVQSVGVSVKYGNHSTTVSRTTLQIRPHWR